MKKIYYLPFTSVFAGGIKSQPPNSYLFSAAVFLSLLSFLISFDTQAQTTFDCSSTSYCSINMKNDLFQISAIDGIQNLSYARVSGSQCATPTIAFNDVEYILDENSGECVTDEDYCSNATTALTFDVYYPHNAAINNDNYGYASYATCKLPMLILVHAGAFSDCLGAKDGPDIVKYCTEFAKRGFVVFSINYRVGSVHLPSSPNYSYNDYKTAQQQLAVYRAVQDLRGAIKSICKMVTEGNAYTAGANFTNKFRADVDKLFLGGASAGSGVVLSTVYLSTQEMAEACNPDIASVLGNIDQDYYYACKGDPMPVIKGVLDMWGDFPMPGSITTEAAALAFFNKNPINSIPPVISFHGSKDNVTAPYYKQEDFPSSSILYDPYRITSLCPSGIIFTVNHNIGAHDLLMIGTLALRDLLLAKSIMAECYIDCEMGHGLSSATNPVTGYLLSNFGTTINNELDLQVYIVQRAAVFFQSILLGATAIQGKNTFIECENTRYNTFATTCKSLEVITEASTCGSCVKCKLISVPDCPLPWE